MFSIHEYWVPYVWAQRKFRNENYAMQSQGVLEDMFYDTLGHFLHKTTSDARFERRTGNESWDYRYHGIGFSHKEASGPRFTAIWQPGEGPGNATPKYATWTFAHHIVFSYFPPIIKTNLSWDGKSRSGKPRHNAVTARAVSHAAIARSLKSRRATNTAVVICDTAGDTLTIQHVLPLGDWKNETLRTIQARIRSKAATSVSMWLVETPQSILNTGFHWAKDGPGLTVTLGQQPLMSGIYVLPTRELYEVPLQSNNKAHFPRTEFVRQQMAKAVVDDRFVLIPMWPEEFVATTAPNLYQQVRNEYDLLFSARERH
jgi:hypothetical protein